MNRKKWIEEMAGNCFMVTEEDIESWCDQYPELERCYLKRKRHEITYEVAERLLDHGVFKETTEQVAREMINVLHRRATAANCLWYFDISQTALEKLSHTLFDGRNFALFQDALMEYGALHLPSLDGTFYLRGERSSKGKRCWKYGAKLCFSSKLHRDATPVLVAIQSIWKERKQLWKGGESSASSIHRS